MEYGGIVDRVRPGLEKPGILRQPVPGLNKACILL